MRVDGKSEGPRQSMSWLHTWISLLLGWLLYAVFLTGTLSFFQSEISIWMKPELHQSISTQTKQQQLSTALTVLQQRSANAGAWNIRFPNSRQPTLNVTVREQGEDPRGRRGGNQLILDSATGEEIKPRETRGGGFLYRFHFELYGIDRIWGRWIVGIATMFMFVAIISGIITHKKIFTDFFTFRPGKGQRSWLDAHNATAVFALPFHIMITFSGLLLLMYMLMPWAMNGAYPGGRQEFFEALNNQNNPNAQNNVQQNQNRQNSENNQTREQRSGTGNAENRQRSEGMQQAREAQNTGSNQRSETMQAQGNNNQRSEATQTRGENRERGEGRRERQQPQHEAATMADLTKILSYAQQQWGDNPVASMNIINPNTVVAEVEITAQNSESLMLRDRTPKLKFNAITGEIIPNTDEPSKTAVPSAIYNLVTWLHMARGVDSILRWLLFLSGVLGTMMVATGLILWVVKRAPDVQKLGYKPFGHRFVEVMNVATIVGLPIACASYFWANRFIPAQMAERSAMEIKVFFTVWLITLIYAIIRPHRQAWLEQLAFVAVMYLFTPIINFATGGRALWSSIYHQQWMIASFDIICLILAAIFAYSYYKLKRYKGLPVKVKKVAKPVAAEEQA